MDLLNNTFIEHHKLKKLNELMHQDQLRPLRCIQELMNDENNEFLEAFVFDNEYFYTIICHCTDVELYNETVLKYLCCQYAVNHRRPGLRNPEIPYLIIITKPRIYNEPITEDMDLSNMFSLYSWDWTIPKEPNLNDVFVCQEADLLVRKYTNINDIISCSGSIICTFNDTLHDQNKMFYDDLLVVLLKNKNNEDIQRLNA